MPHVPPFAPVRGGAGAVASRVLVATGVVVALGAGCTGDEPSDAAGPTPSPTAVATADVGASPAPSPGGAHEPVTDRATAPTDSVVDPQGRPPPEPEPAADLRAVDVTLDADGVTTTFDLAGPVPDEVASLLWSVELRVDGERAYTASLQQVGAERSASVVDWDTNDAVALSGDAVRVDDHRVELRLALADVPRVADGFAWTAQTQLDGAWEDHVPADGDARQVRP